MGECQRANRALGLGFPYRGTIFGSDEPARCYFHGQFDFVRWNGRVSSRAAPPNRQILCVLIAPTSMPTPSPTAEPTSMLTAMPSPLPTPSPTAEPTPMPTAMPSPLPTPSPPAAVILVDVRS